MQASIGASAGPIRLSQALPGIGAIIVAIPAIGVFGGFGWVLGLTNEAATQMPEDGTYSTTRSAPEGSKIEPGTYRTTVPKPTSDGDTCWWKVSSGSDNSVLNQGEPKPGTAATVTVPRGRYFKTFYCGTWVKVS